MEIRQKKIDSSRRAFLRHSKSLTDRDRLVTRDFLIVSQYSNYGPISCKRFQDKKRYLYNSSPHVFNTPAERVPIGIL